MNWITNHMLAFILGSGVVIFAVVEGLRAMSKTIKKLPPWATRFGTLIVSTGVVALATWAKTTVTCDVNDVVNTCLDALANNQGAIKIILGALAAFGVNWLDAKRKAAKK